MRLCLLRLMTWKTLSWLWPLQGIFRHPNCDLDTRLAERRERIAAGIRTASSRCDRSLAVRVQQVTPSLSFNCFSSS